MDKKQRIKENDDCFFLFFAISQLQTPRNFQKYNERGFSNQQEAHYQRFRVGNALERVDMIITSTAVNELTFCGLTFAPGSLKTRRTLAMEVQVCPRERYFINRLLLVFVFGSEGIHASPTV